MTEMSKTGSQAANDYAAMISALVHDSRAAQLVLAQSSYEVRIAALTQAAKLIRGATDEILARNALDVTHNRSQPGCRSWTSLSSWLL